MAIALYILALTLAGFSGWAFYGVHSAGLENPATWNWLLVGSITLTGAVLTFGLAGIVGKLDKLRMDFAEDEVERGGVIEPALPPVIAASVPPAFSVPPVVAPQPVGSLRGDAEEDASRTVAPSYQSWMPEASVPAVEPYREPVFREASRPETQYEPPYQESRYQAPPYREPVGEEPAPGVSPHLGAAELQNQDGVEEQATWSDSSPVSGAIQAGESEAGAGNADVPATAVQDDPVAGEADSRVIVGQHEAGGNRYVLYADGSIDAETAKGRFHFASLDEMRAFIAGSGRSGETNREG